MPIISATTAVSGDDEMKIAPVETADDSPVGGVQGGALFVYRPVSRQRPFVAAELRRSSANVRLARQDAAGRGEVLGAFVADIVSGDLELVTDAWRMRAPDALVGDLDEAGHVSEADPG